MGSITSVLWDELGASFTDIAALAITNNASLLSLDGLGGLEEGTITKLTILDCPNLSVCEVESICNYLMAGGLASISGNGQGCNTVTEVEEACQLNGTEESGAHQVSVYPNPASGLLYLSSGNEQIQWEVAVKNSMGMLLLKQKVFNGAPIDLSELPTGWYMLEMKTDGATFVKPAIKK